jgi:hypothetical protein
MGTDLTIPKNHHLLSALIGKHVNIQDPGNRQPKPLHIQADAEDVNHNIQ